MLFILTSCKDKTIEITEEPKVQTTEPAVLSEDELLVDLVELAHGKEQFTNKEMVQFDIDLSFGGQQRLEGTVYMSTDSKYVRVDKTDGSSLIYDGKQVWMSPQDANNEGARFDMFTWSYFFALPFKLSDEGTITNLFPDTGNFKVIRLTFENGTGDAPDDWYEIYIDKETDLIDHAGYIVTYGGTPAEKAAENAHAIAYSDYQTVENVPIATSWKFYNYSNGIDRSKVIGEANISNIEFGMVKKDLFSQPENAIEVNL